jgi:hypothetical protein
MSTTSRFARSDGVRRGLRGWLGLLMLASVGWPATVSAQAAAPIELEWTAPDHCPSSRAVLARVRQIAGRAHAAASLTAQATVTERADHQLELQLVLRSGKLVSTRSLKGRSCNDLVGALVVAVAVMLSSDEPLEPPDVAEPASEGTPKSDEARPAPTAAPVAPPPPPPKESPPARDAEPESPPRSWHGLLTLPIVALGVGPEAKAIRGLGLAAGVSFQRFRIHAEGKLWASRAAAAQDDELYGAKLERVTLSLRGCRNVLGEKFELAPCMLVSVQHLSAQGTGPNIASRSEATTWLAPGVGLRARYLIAPWFSLVLGLEGEVQLSRPEVKLEGVGLVERLSPLGGTLAVGSEWIL